MLLFSCYPAGFWAEPKAGVLEVRRTASQTFEIEGSGYVVRVEAPCAIVAGYVVYTDMETLVDVESHECMITLMYPSYPVGFMESDF